MAQTTCKVLGVAFLIAGLVGFVQPHFLGFHLTMIHNVIHLASAAVALYLGFVAPGLVATVLGHSGPVASGELMPDNLFHIVAGAAFLVAGMKGAPAAVRP